MNLFSLNTNCVNEQNSNGDVLSAFRNHNEKEITIKQGMSVNEISDIVSDRLVELIKNQLPKEKKTK
jgi:hypothetical protein